MSRVANRLSEMSNQRNDLEVRFRKLNVLMWTILGVSLTVLIGIIWILAFRGR